jgi:hypothetical protein
MYTLSLSFSLYVYLINLFLSHGAAYRFDVSCDGYQPMINTASLEAVYMISKARDQILGDPWFAPQTILGNHFGSLFPTPLTDDERTQAYGKFLAL